MARFIALVDEDHDVDVYRGDFPEHDFAWVSFNRLRCGSIVIDPHGPSAVIDLLRADHAARPFLGIVFGSMPELYVAAAAHIAAALGLPRFLAHPEAARDKYVMRKRLAAVAPGPQTWLVRTADDAARLTGLTFPCVLKPRYGYGSMCVVRVCDRADLLRQRQLLATALEILSRKNPLAMPSGDMLVETFLEGTEHTVELFFAAGMPAVEIVSDKAPMSPPYFIEVGDVMPSRLATADQHLVRRAARDAARGLGMEHGWVHVEIKLHEGVASVVEIAARHGGGYTHDMVKLAYGLDMRKVLVDSYLGAPPTQPSAENNTVVGRIVVAYGLTVAWGVGRLDRCRRDPRFHEITQRLAGGLPRVFVGPPYSYNNTIMSYLVSHPPRDQALALFRELDASIAIRRLVLWPTNRLVYAAFLVCLRLRTWLQRRSLRPGPGAAT